MEPRNDLREGLLSRVPRPQNLAAYREETASLLAKHERSLLMEKWTASTLSFCGLAALLFYCWLVKARPLDAGGQLSFLLGTLIFVLVAAINGIRFPIYASQVTILKELKQIQLQVLELEASLVQGSSPHAEK